MFLEYHKIDIFWIDFLINFQFTFLIFDSIYEEIKLNLSLILEWIPP